MKRNLPIIAAFSIFILWATVLFSQTVQTPSNVSLSNDGVNKATIESIGGKRALDVNVIQSVSTGSGGTASSVTVSSGTVTAYQGGTWTVVSGAAGTTPVTQATQTWNVGGVVSVSNLPATQPVSWSTQTVGISNYPLSQAVTGTVGLSSVPTHTVTGTFWQATQPVSWTTQTVGISSNVTTSAIGVTPVSGTFWQSTQPVSWSTQTVGISNLPATQPVSWSTQTIGVSNFPASQAVTGTFWQSTQPVSWSTQTVGISNLPATQNVSTTVSASFTHNQVTVTNSATLISALNANRKSLVVRNQGATDMLVGGSGVTTGNGLSVKTGEVLILDRTTAAIYGIVSAGTTTAGYLEE